MKIETMMLGSMASNTYLLHVGAQRVVVIDIGDAPQKLLRALEQEQLTVEKILLTHGHYDHVAGVAAVQQATGAAVYIHEADAAMLTDPQKNLGSWIAPQAGFRPVQQFHTVQDGDTISTDDGTTLTVLHTPGHTPGSVCFLCEDVMFSGDTLFRMSYGRTDFPGGSEEQMQQSLRRLRRLPGDYRVYPGHNRDTTLSFERDNNPMMRYLP